MADNFTPEQIEQFLQEFFTVVGRRQYIGARYVPMFGRKGESSIEWDNSAPYEPLTVVTYQGMSYTSRTYVPTGVDIHNTEYWAATGNYDSQVEQYREEVHNLSLQVETFQDSIDDVSEQVNTVSEVIPAEDFNPANTVKDYIDTSIVPLNNKTNITNHPIRVIAVSPVLDTGECSIIITEDGVVVSDFSNVQSASEVTLALINAGISHIDVGIISHYHTDHTGALLNGNLDNYIDSDTVFYIAPSPTASFIDMINQMNLVIAKLNALGVTFIVPNDNNNEAEFGNYSFEFYNLNYTAYDSIGNYNNESMVTKLTYYNESIVLSGDISTEAQKQMIGKITDCTVYKAHHHGSDYQQFSPYLANLNFKYTYVCSMENNATMFYYRRCYIPAVSALGAPIYSTSTNGTFSFIINQDGTIETSAIPDNRFNIINSIEELQAIGNYSGDDADYTLNNFVSAIPNNTTICVRVLGRFTSLLNAIPYIAQLGVSIMIYGSKVDTNYFNLICVVEATDMPVAMICVINGVPYVSTPNPTTFFNCSNNNGVLTFTESFIGLYPNTNVSQNATVWDLTNVRTQTIPTRCDIRMLVIDSSGTPKDGYFSIMTPDGTGSYHNLPVHTSGYTEEIHLSMPLLNIRNAPGLKFGLTGDLATLNTTVMITFSLANILIWR